MNHLGFQGGSVFIVGLDLAVENGGVLGLLGLVEGLFLLEDGLGESEEDIVLLGPVVGVLLNGVSEGSEISVTQGIGEIGLGLRGSGGGLLPGGLGGLHALSECSTIGDTLGGSGLNCGVSSGLLVSSELPFSLLFTLDATVVLVVSPVGESEGGSRVESTRGPGIPPLVGIGGKGVELGDLGISAEDSGSESSNGGSSGSSVRLEVGERLLSIVEGSLGSGGGGLGSGN